jgi:hypothetical protein
MGKENSPSKEAIKGFRQDVLINLKALEIVEALIVEALVNNVEVIVTTHTEAERKNFHILFQKHRSTSTYCLRSKPDYSSGNFSKATELLKMRKRLKHNIDESAKRYGRKSR